MNIIITLAGKSERFKKAGIVKPKFLLPIDKTTVIEKILESYDDQDNFHLVLTKSQIIKNKNLKYYLKKLKKNIYLNIINDHDFGPTYSALKARTCELKKDIIVSYCDFLIDWDYKKFKRNIFEYDLGITSFRGFHPSSFSGTLYCYLKIKNNEIQKLREKQSFTTKPFNEFASAGSYYFKNFELLKYYSNKALNSKKLNTKFKEIYMSLPYLFALEEKKPILNFELDKFISLGTPRDYMEYIDWFNFFKKKNLAEIYD
jgi:NDP-sugar pyrophosphorylase family protein